MTKIIVYYIDDYTVKYKNGDKETKDIKITETLELAPNNSVNTWFSADSDVEKLFMEIPSEEIIYTLTFGDGGLAYVNSTGMPNSSYFGQNSSMTIPFMGKTYKILEVSTDGDQIKLVEQGSSSLYDEGSTIEVTGTDGETYTLSIDQVYGDSESGEIAARMSLLKDGTPVAVDGFFSGDDVEFDNYPLEESITVINVFLATQNATSAVKLSMGSAGQLTLEDGEALPGYEDDDDVLWVVDITDTGPNGTPNGTIDTIEVYNKELVWDVEDLEDEDAGLIPGDEITLPLNLGKLSFVGPTTETTYEFSVGSGNVSWKDDQGQSHETFLYKKNAKNTSVTIDGEKYYFEITGNQLDVRTDNSSGTPVITNLDVNDWNVLSDPDFVGANGVKLTYYAKLENNELHLALGKTGTDYALGKSTEAKWNFMGVYDNNGLTSLDAAIANDDLDTNVDYNFYDKSKASTKGEDVAVFKIVDGSVTGGQYLSYFFVDVYTENLAKEDDYNAANYYSQALYDENTAFNHTDIAWKLDQDDPDTDMKMGYTNYGTILKVDGSKGYAIVPADQLYLQVFVGGAISPEEQEAITKMFTLTNKGALVSDPTTGLGAKLVDFEVTAGTPGTCTAVSPVSFSATNLVKLDTAAPAGKKIIVGGQNANNLAKIQYGLEDLLTQSGNYVMGKATNGDIVVAGYNWEDTQAAADDLIDIIEGFQ